MLENFGQASDDTTLSSSFALCCPCYCCICIPALRFKSRTHCSDSFRFATTTLPDTDIPHLDCGHIAYASYVARKKCCSWKRGKYYGALHRMYSSSSLVEQAPSYDLTMPEDSVNLWSWLTFSFVEPIFEVSNKRTLNEIDCWSLSPYFKHKNIFNKYLEYYEKYALFTLALISCTPLIDDDLPLDILNTRCGVFCS